MLDESGIIKKANQEFCSLFDVSCEAIENKPLNIFLEPFLLAKAITELKISELIVHSFFEIEREYLIQDKPIKLKEKYTTLLNANGKTEIILLAIPL
jgi:transcriptional regulator of aromatic amino acid metabolism